MNQNTEIKILRQYEDVPRPVVHKTEHPNFEARLAVNLLEKWGMVAAETTGRTQRGELNSASLPRRNSPLGPVTWPRK